MSQAPGVIEFWEKVLFENSYKRFIEFGTYKGGLSMFFLLWSIQRKAEFYTYDNMAHKMSRIAYHLHLPKYFKKLDIFEHEEEIGKLIQAPGVTILFCDNGDKPKELKVFSKYLKIGDIIGVHDWLTEVQPSDIPEELQLIYLHTDKMPYTAVFKKI